MKLPLPRLSHLLLAILAASLPLFVNAAPQVDSISPTNIESGDVLTIEGSGFLTDPSRYSVLLRDGKSIVALGQVLSAEATGLEVLIVGLGATADSAQVVIREGVEIDLVPQMGKAEVRTASWFHSSGVSIIVDGISMLPSTPRIWENTDVEQLEETSRLGCLGGSFDLDIPFGCTELTASISVGGDDPFGPPPPLPPGIPEANLKTIGGIVDAWQGTLTASLGDGQTILTSPDVAQKLAQLLSKQWGVFGINAEVGPNGTQVVVLGERMSQHSAVAIMDLSCESFQRDGSANLTRP